ncbi:MAG TPA: HNH endonuclease signature motif containing protein [Acidimicrobiales bacterium]|nr:HNH endonuclease signature motif containing protein [Acidimicrobiales bacterium]
MSPRAVAFADELFEITPLVKARAGHQCEVPGEHLGGLSVHHRLRRSQGGTNDLENLLLVCARHHRHIHDHPAASYEAGTLLRRTK